MSYTELVVWYTAAVAGLSAWVALEISAAWRRWQSRRAGRAARAAANRAAMERMQAEYMGRPDLLREN